MIGNKEKNRRRVYCISIHKVYILIKFTSNTKEVEKDEKKTEHI